jgi:menaquinone-dependent protoporphyrinogen oxidase
MMNGKILVTYATRCGSTEEIAQTIGRTLSAEGAEVEVRPVKEVRSLAGYRAVVVGSAIRMGRWLPEAAKFVEKQRETLRRLPTAYFLASIYLVEDTPEMKRTVLAYLDPVRKVLEPASIGLFAGKVDLSKLSWLERKMAESTKSPVGDFRDWGAVQTWTEELRKVGFAA